MNKGWEVVTHDTQFDLTEQQKALAMEVATRHVTKKSYPMLAKEYGISRTTLFEWRKNPYL